MAKKTVSPLQKALNLWAIILLVWGLYRYFFKADLPIWFDEFIAKPIVLVLPVYYYITHYEKKKFADGIDFHLKTLGRDLLWGLSIGLIFFVAAAIGTNQSLNKIMTELPQAFTKGSTILLFVVAFATSISEEILSRGFILKRIYAQTKNVPLSTTIATILFFFLHIPFLLTSQQLMGNTLLQVMVTDFLLSYAVSFLFLQSRSLMVPILVHAFYSISIYFFHFAFS